MRTLLIGSKNYSSWSLRPWLFLRKVDLNFAEQIIHFDESGYQSQIAALSPSKRVPLLIDAGVKIWDSLAICEYAAELSGRGLPSERLARARARAVAAEMHSGFQALRNECPMNVRASKHSVPWTPELQADIARIDEIWAGCRSEYGGAGGWLFGEFSIADVRAGVLPLSDLRCGHKSGSGRLLEPCAAGCGPARLARCGSEGGPSLARGRPDRQPAAAPSIITAYLP
jgi:glutathione S-transferase